LNRRHFIRLHRERPQHAGIVVCTVDPDFAGQADRIHKAISGQDSLKGQLIRVNRVESAAAGATKYILRTDSVGR